MSAIQWHSSYGLGTTTVIFTGTLTNGRRRMAWTSGVSSNQRPYIIASHYLLQHRLTQSQVSADARNQGATAPAPNDQDQLHPSVYERSVHAPVARGTTLWTTSDQWVTYAGDRHPSNMDTSGRSK